MARKHPLYKAVWFWSEDDNKLSVFGITDKENPNQKGCQLGSTIKLLDNVHLKPKTFYFTDNIDQNQQMIFRQRYQRGIKPHVPNVVTLQDVKDVVMFLANGYIPPSFIALFYSMDINLLLRSVILYIQLYLKIWEDLEYRSNSYKNQRLKHPISIERERLCRNNLSKLRGRIGQEYALIISGERTYKVYHHMNNTLNRSYTDQDMMLYDYLAKFITRVVWIALNRINFKEIETEIYRLFHFKDINQGKESRKFSVKSEHKSDGQILHGNSMTCLSKWHKQSPVVSDIFMNQEIPDELLEHNFSDDKSEKRKLTGLEAALTLPEELLTSFDITVGILGQPRDNFEPLLTVKQKQKTAEEEELEKMLSSQAEEVKPKVKMYEYLLELETAVNLESYESPEESTNIFDLINLYEKGHVEESNRSYKLFRKKRFSSGYVI